MNFYLNSRENGRLENEISDSSTSLSDHMMDSATAVTSVRRVDY
jgi:hypothetical protein